MADATPGFEGKVSADGDEITSAVDADFSNIVNDLDATTFGDEEVQRDYGLKDAECSITCLYAPSETGQSTIQDAIDNRDDVTIEYLPDGNNGFSADFMVTDESLSSNGPDGRNEIEYSLSLATGSISRV